jgi:hypothetical protein
MKGIWKVGKSKKILCRPKSKAEKRTSRLPNQVQLEKLPESKETLVPPKYKGANSMLCPLREPKPEKRKVRESNGVLGQ